MDKSQQNLNRSEPWWKPGVQIFSEVSSWIFVPIVLALILGKYLDNRWGTKPTMLLISAGLGFLVTAYGIVNVVKNYMKKIKKDESRTKS